MLPWLNTLAECEGISTLAYYLSDHILPTIHLFWLESILIQYHHGTGFLDGWKLFWLPRTWLLQAYPALWIVYYNLATYLWCPVDYCLKWKFATNADIVFRSTFIYTGVCSPIWMSSSSRNLLILWLADFYVGFIWVIHMYLSLNFATVTLNILHFLFTWGLFNITL